MLAFRRCVFTQYRSAFRAAWLCALAVAAVTGVHAEEKTDHPLLSGVGGTVISSKEVQQFGVIEPSVAGRADGKMSFEGKVTKIFYVTLEGSPPGEVKIYRNYLAAITKMGGRQLNKGFNPNDTVSLVTGAHVFTLAAGPRPPVAVLNITNAYNYLLTIVEPEVMEQSVRADQLGADIKAKGFATLHINFDTNKSELKPDGVQAVDEVVKLMNSDPSLRLSIEGHTDNIGSAVANQKLSEMRAQAVVAGIEARGINSNRLAFKGYGARKPVTENSTDAGRSINRRVELVKVP